MTDAPLSSADRFVHAIGATHDPAVDLVQLLGGKGAGLHVMATRLGLPVPPGFTIGVPACRAHQVGGWPDGLDAELDAELGALEARLDRRLGDPVRPLLVSVRSGAPVSMPGMLDSILDVGLTDATAAALAAETGDARFTADCHRRLVAMFATTVMGVPRAGFDDLVAAACTRWGGTDDRELPAAALEELVLASKHLVVVTTGERFPEDPREQLRMAVEAVFRSWTGARAVEYRRIEGIPDDGGTAVTVQAMVFGNRGPRSGTGVAFSRDPVTGAPGLTGDWLERAQGEDVVAGNRPTRPLSDLARDLPDAHAALVAAVGACEREARDVVDVEFTVDDGTLWVLQSRIARRAARAAVRIVVDLVDEGAITAAEAVDRIDPALVAQLAATSGATGATAVATGIAASAGVAQGRAYFTADDALDASDRGEAVLLVRPETSPDDVHGMAVAEGILTARGGLVSHAAVVARAWGKPAVVGVDALVVEARRCTIAGHAVAEGDVVSIDGTTGAVYVGAVDELSTPLPPELDRLRALADAVGQPDRYVPS